MSEQYQINQRELKDGEPISLVAAVASAGIHITSVTPLQVVDNGGGYEFINLAVCYEFQWKSRGNYIWNKTCSVYTVDNMSSQLNSENEKKGLKTHSIYNDLPVDCIDFELVMEDVICKVMEARDQLEDPDDRGRYAYKFIPSGAPKDIKERIWG